MADGVQGGKIADAQLVRMKAAESRSNEPELSRSAPSQLQGIPAPLVAKPPLADQVSDWRKFVKKAAVQAGGERLRSKFVAAGDSFTFEYATVKEFYAGLEGLVGSPSSDVMTAMVRDHASTEAFDAENAGKKRTTTPRAEWLYVVEGVVGVEVPEEAGRDRHPSHAKDSLAGVRVKADGTPWALEDFAAQPKIKEAGLMLAEVAGIRL
jgi:hypothetical protein